MKKTTGLVLLVLILILLVLAAIYFFTVPYRNVRPDEPKLPAELEVTLYFANQEYIETGNEELAKILPVSRRVATGGSREQLVAAVLEELRTPPPDSGLTTALHGELKITGVRVEGNTAFVDFDAENLHGGSLEEILLVGQIVKTLTGLVDIEQVQFLVNGERRDTLMGHIGTHEPLGREDI